MRPTILCAALVAACAAPTLTPAEVARVHADDAARVCRALRAPDPAACEAAVVRHSQELSPYQPPNRETVSAYIQAAEQCSNAGWAFATPGQMACVENQRREMAEAARRREESRARWATAAMIMGAGLSNAYATPVQVPRQQTTNCSPDFLGGFRCTSY